MGDWWIYRGIIPPGRFAAVDHLDGGEVGEAGRRMIPATSPARTSRLAMVMLGVDRPGAS